MGSPPSGWPLMTGTGRPWAGLRPLDRNAAFPTPEDDGASHKAELPERVVEPGEDKARTAAIALGETGAATPREELQLDGIVQATPPHRD